MKISILALLLAMPLIISAAEAPTPSVDQELNAMTEQLESGGVSVKLIVGKNEQGEKFLTPELTFESGQIIWSRTGILVFRDASTQESYTTPYIIINKLGCVGDGCTAKKETIERLVKSGFIRMKLILDLPDEVQNICPESSRFTT